MSKHTPGPWRWGTGWSDWKPRESEYDGPKYLDLQLYGANMRDVVIPSRVDHHELILDASFEEPFCSEADRNLIEAAPELLKECKKALNALELEYGKGCSPSLAAVIAKADRG